jgi:hypothetical protein
MIRPVTIVTLSRYVEFFKDYTAILNIYDPGVPRIIVRDGNEIPDSMLEGWQVLEGVQPFSITKNINKGWFAVPSDHDIFFVSDDVRFTMHDTTARMQEIAYSDKYVGIISPKLLGRGSPKCCNPASAMDETTPCELWYPCVYIKRAVIDAIGYFDESFPFGKDDIDFNIRAIDAGFSLAVTNAVSVVHEATATGDSPSSSKTYGSEEIRNRMNAGLERLREKYGEKWDELQWESFTARRQSLGL